MLEFKTIESDRYEKMVDGIHVKHVGMITAQEAFDQLKEHLKKVGLLPDEYFLVSHNINAETELPVFTDAICHTKWGGNEGVYIDIDLKYFDDFDETLPNNERQAHFFHLATGKTLGANGDDFLRMSRIAAECSMMLNGRGSIVRVSENVYENTHLTEQEKALVFKALDAMGDKVADTQGFSAGEKYWNLKEKFESISKEEPNEFLKGKSSGFVEVYKLVKAARIPNYNAKALEDIRDKYGYDLYKEALEVVLKEQEVQLYTQMQKAFELLPANFDKDKITPYVFYTYIKEYPDEFPEVPVPTFQQLMSTLNCLKLSFIDDEFIELFNNIQSQHKPSLSSQIQSAEAKSANCSPNTTTPSIEAEPIR